MFLPCRQYYWKAIKNVRERDRRSLLRAVSFSSEFFFFFRFILYVILSFLISILVAYTVYYIVYRCVFFGFEDIVFELNLGRRGDVVHQLSEMDAAVIFSPENVAWLADEAISVKGGAVVVVGEFWKFIKLVFEIFFVQG
ncbi:hypothetical protein ACP275_05G124900 [Erythranthe tilingii]